MACGTKTLSNSQVHSNEDTGLFLGRRNCECGPNSEMCHVINMDEDFDDNFYGHISLLASVSVRCCSESKVAGKGLLPPG